MDFWKSVFLEAGQAQLPAWAAFVASLIFAMRSLYFFTAAASWGFGFGGLQVGARADKTSRAFREHASSVGAAPTRLGMARRRAEARKAESCILKDDKGDLLKRGLTKDDGDIPILTVVVDGKDIEQLMGSIRAI